MASLKKKRRDSNTVYEVDVTTYGSRKSIWLGAVSKSSANQIFSYLQQLEFHKNHGTQHSTALADWLDTLSAKFYDKLVKAGLVEAKCQKTVEGFFADQLAMLRCSERTRDIYSRAHSKFVDFIGIDCLLTEVTPEMASGFHDGFLFEQGLAPSYRSKTCRIVREFFDKAVKFKLVQYNPFNFKISSEVSRERHRYIEREDITTIVKSASDFRFAAIIAFAGLCGLRARSELAAIKWEYINWDAGTFTVPGVKTAERECPLFADFLRVGLEPYYRELGCPKIGLVFPSCPTQTQLTRRLKKTIESAGFEPWPKPWMNLRSSVETFLIREGFDIYQVTRWLGNSPEVARKHYLQTTAKDIKRATQIGSQKSPDSPRNTEEQGGIVRNAQPVGLPNLENKEVYARLGEMEYT